MALLMVMTVCLLVYAALEYRIRTALKEHGATFPDQKGRRIPNPTTRWVFHYFVGIHVLYIPGQGLMILNLTDEHQHLLELLGKRYAWFYRYKCIQIRPSMRKVGRTLRCIQILLSGRALACQSPPESLMRSLW